MKFYASALSLALLFSVSVAILPSRGSLTTQAARQNLTSSDYVIVPQDGVAVEQPGFTAYLSSVQTLPALGLADVQLFFASAMLKSNETYPKHYHPRSAELLTLIEGEGTFYFSDESGKEFAGPLKPLESVVFPQGLLHYFACVGATSCRFHAVLNSADPGSIRV